MCVRATLQPNNSQMTRVVTTTNDVEVETKIKDAVVSSKMLEGQCDVTCEPIKSYYWWEDKIQTDDEVSHFVASPPMHLMVNLIIDHAHCAQIRISFETSSTFQKVLEVVSGCHNYKVPMIIAESNDSASTHWKGEIEHGSEELATELLQLRLVACAQLSNEGNLVLKTQATARAPIETRLGNRVKVQWAPITGNTAYLDWLVAETNLGDES